jgi:hypothetical protein
VVSKPIIIKFVSGHDIRLNSIVSVRETETIYIEFHFSADMNCDAIINGLTFNSLSFGFRIPKVNKASVNAVMSLILNFFHGLEVFSPFGFRLRISIMSLIIFIKSYSITLRQSTIIFITARLIISSSVLISLII